MKLIELYAEEFGIFTDRRFSLGEGLNLIEGANESGKSTLQALIRFLFYGFPRRGGEEGEERYRRMSRKTHRAAGSLTLLWQGEVYLIYRDYVLHTTGAREVPAEVLRVTAKASGKEIDLGGKTPGEYFLSLPAELYHSSVCVRQSEIASVADPETGGAVADKLFFGEGGARLEVAERILDDARRALLHNRGKGGRITELEGEVEALEAALDEARRDAERLRVLRNDMARFSLLAQDKARELKKIEEMQQAARLDAELARFDAWHAAKKEEETLLAACKANGMAENEQATPTPAQYREAREELDRYEMALGHTALCDKARQAAAQEAARYGRDKASLYITAQGGANACAARAARLARKKRISMTLCVFFCIFAALCGVGSVLKRELFFPFLCALGGFGVLAAVAVFLSKRAAKAARELYLALGVSSPRMLRTVLTQYEKDQGELAAATAASAQANRLYEQALASEQTHARTLAKLLDDMGAPDLSPTPGAIRAYLDAVWQREMGSRAACDEARMRYEAAKSARTALENGLNVADEAALRARRAALPTPDADAARLSQKRAFLEETSRGIAEKLAAAEREEIAVAARAADPAALLTEKNEAQAALAAAKNRLSAIKMASEALSEANEALRASVVPALAEKASEIFAKLTGGTWKSLHVTDNFAISVETPQGDVPLSHFSAGCRDAAHFALRLALADRITSEPLPLLLDEVTARLDDTRTAQLLLLLCKLCQGGGQCLLFTCHTREAALLGGESYTRIKL